MSLKLGKIPDPSKSNGDQYHTLDTESIASSSVPEDRFPITDVLERDNAGLLATTFRNSPGDALVTFYARVNLVVTAIVNWGLNVGFGFGLLHSYDRIGLWSKTNTPNADSTPIWEDLLFTALILIFLSSMLLAPGVRKEISKGIIIPVANSDLKRGIWRLFPLTISSAWLRASIFAGQFAILVWGPTVGVFYALCQTGHMGDDCSMDVKTFCWFKGAWAGVLAACAYPFLLLASLNRAHVPDDVYDQFLEQQGARPAV